MDQPVKPIPDGMHTVTPHLVCAGAAKAIEFYKKAFNAVELGKVPEPGGKLLHALIRIGDSPVMLVDEFPDHHSLGPKSLNVVHAMVGTICPPRDGAASPRRCSRAFVSR